MGAMTPEQAAGALRAAGWPRPMWPVMIAIGKAESGLRIDAKSPVNTNGTTDYGWLQINSRNNPYGDRLRSDAVYTAKAGLSIWQRQGLNAWTVYKTGAYRQYLQLGYQGAAHPVDPPKGSGGGDGGGLLDKAGDLAGGAAKLGATAALGPLALVDNPFGAIKDTGQAVITVASLGVRGALWMADPHNWLRIVEVVGGSVGVLLALRMIASSGVGGPVGTAAGTVAKATKRVTSNVTTGAAMLGGPVGAAAKAGTVAKAVKAA